MKRMITLVFSAVLLTGCSRIYAPPTSAVTPNAPVETTSATLPDGLTITGIIAHETGGEDGRDTEWMISPRDGAYAVEVSDYRRDQILTYHITEEDFQSIVLTDFTDYIGKKDESIENLCDAVEYHTQIAYEGGTILTSDVYIPELWNQLYAVTTNYQPANITYPFDDDDDAAPSDSGTAGMYTYRIGSQEGKTMRGYYLKDADPSGESVCVSISMGERSTGGYSITVDSIRADGDTVTVTVKETAPDPTAMVTEAFTYPGCMVEISPKPAHVIVQSTGGVRFDEISSLNEDGSEDIGELYCEKVRPEDFLYDEEHNVSYAKNQLLISADPTTDRNTIVQLAEEVDADIVGEIALTGDYQFKFRHDTTLDELEQIADQLNNYPFVWNVTLNLIEEVATDE